MLLILMIQCYLLAIGKAQFTQCAHISTSTVDCGTFTHIFLERDHLYMMLTNTGLFSQQSA